MDKDTITAKIKELEDIQIRIEIKKKEVNKEIMDLRSQYYRIVDKENAEKKKIKEAKGPPDMSFLDDAGWSDFN